MTSKRETHPRKALVPILETEPGITMDVSDEQSQNICSRMAVSELERLTDDNLSHPQNALMSMSVTESGMTMEDSEIQSRNALDPIEFTESGMVIADKEVQPRNASKSI